ncbi:MAG TPA: alpha/beta hydrolase, partial [Herpetosiphonaceae bacterium]|nr:alpha/beta hydrolase [Herpetosiphonaceae bacterium]
MRATAIVISVLIGLVGGLGAAMLVFPATNFQFFSAGVGAMEWAPWFLIAGLAGLGLAAVGLRGGSGAWRVASWAGLALNLAASLVIGWRFAAAVTTEPLVRSNMPAVLAGGPGKFSPARFLSGDDIEPGGLRERNLAYATIDGQQLKLDVYGGGFPDRTGNAPALVIVHGGSWRTGDKGDVPAFSERLAGRGYVVFDVAYRLAPDARFPAAVSDVKCAIGYIKANAARFGIDPGRLVLLGRSAGAQIALVAAYAPDAAELPASCPAGDTSVSAVIGYYAPTLMDYYNVIKPELSPGALDDYLGGPPESFAEAYRQARPATWLGPNSPPTLLLHGSRDQFVRPADSAAIADQMERLGRPYAFIELPWANHGFDFNPDGVNSQ